MAAPSEGQKPPPSSGELFSSAKVVADAAQAYFQGGGDKVEKTQVGDAASDLLGAASHYGKLQEKGYGEYVEKAETYLQQYGSATPGGGATGGAAKPPAAATGSSAAPAGDEAKSGEGGGYGEYAKLAQGLLGGGGEGGGAAKSEGGGYGEGVLKLAGGFLK